jgi:hypothetical protein
VGVHDVRWDNVGTVKADFFCENGKENLQLGTGFLYTT